MKHLVEMHKKLADKGLVVITVSLDAPDEKDDVKTANDYLRKENPPFRHFLLNEPGSMWQEKFNLAGPPCYYIFDRRGKWVRFQVEADGKAVDHTAMDKVIHQLLNEK